MGEQMREYDEIFAFTEGEQMGECDDTAFV